MNRRSTGGEEDEGSCFLPHDTHPSENQQTRREDPSLIRTLTDLLREEREEVKTTVFQGREEREESRKRRAGHWKRFPQVPKLKDVFCGISRGSAFQENDGFIQTPAGGGRQRNLQEEEEEEETEGAIGPQTVREGEEENTVNRVAIIPSATTTTGSLMSLAAAIAQERLLRVSEERCRREGGEGWFGGDGWCCCVCMVREKCAAFVPCGHSFCRVCSRELWVHRGCCPLCNGQIVGVLDIF